MPKVEPIIELKQGPDGTYVPLGACKGSRQPRQAHARRTRSKAKAEPPPKVATGRLDMLVSGTLEKLVEKSDNPLLRMFYEQAKPTLDDVFREKLGPPRRIR
jgi:hypothetical protein